MLVRQPAGGMPPAGTHYYRRFDQSYMSRLLGSSLALIVIGLLLGCSLGGQVAETPVPLAEVSPAASATTGAGSNPTQAVVPASASSAAQLTTASPAPIKANPTLPVLPTASSIPHPDSTNLLLRIAAPGPMSKVVSPIDFVVYIAPDDTGLTRIQLLGEDGRELFSKAFRTYSNIGSPTRVVEQINFEIHGAAELGRLQVSTVDQYGRMQAFNSVRVLLLSAGENELTPPYPQLERVLLRAPKPDDEISGGFLSVEGQIQPVNDQPVVLELYDTDGNAIGSRILTLRHADGTYQLFSTIIPYKIGKKTLVRLMIHQSDDRIDGLAYLFSLNLLIDP